MAAMPFVNCGAAETPAAVEAAVADPPAAPQFTNGIAAIAERVVDDLAAPTAAPTGTV